jgi:cell shape-determining protein MreC
MTSPNPFDTLRRNRRRTPVAARLVALLVFLLVCGAVLYWRNGFANALWNAVSPAAMLRTRLESGSVGQLQAELASTTAALADRDALAQENAELKRLLGRPQASAQVLGAVLLRPPGIPYDTLVIDVGSKDGVVAGDVVFGGGTLAIGDVTDVYEHTSRVSLFSAPGRSYDAQIAPRLAPSSIVPVSLEGQGAGSFVGQIPAGSAAAPNDPVLIPGIGNSFLGGITHIDAPSGSSFETVYIQMPVNIFSLKYVEVQTRL